MNKHKKYCFLQNNFKFCETFFKNLIYNYLIFKIYENDVTIILH